MNAQTSDRISSLAAKYARMTADELLVATSDAVLRRETAEEIRSMAMSLLRQVEPKGLRRIFKKVFW